MPESSAENRKKGQEEDGEVKALKGRPLAVSRSPGPPGLFSVFSLGCRAIEHIGIEFEFVDYTKITSPM